MVLLEYIETKEYGKIAHFLTDDNKDVFSRVLTDNDSIIYEELSEEIQMILRKKYLKDEN